MATSVFPLRFKDPATKAMLRLVSEQLGIPMNEIAEEAVRQELIMLGAGIQEQLTQIIEQLREYDPDRDMAKHVAAVIEGESLPDPLQARQLSVQTHRAASLNPSTAPAERDPRLAGALTAFGQGR